MADEWGGEPVQPVAAFQDQYGTWVARFVIGGVPVLVFSEGDAPPELAAYPDDGSAVLAYQRHYRVDAAAALRRRRVVDVDLDAASADGGRQPRTAGEVRPGDMVMTRTPRGPREHTVQRTAPGPAGVVEIWFSDTFHWTLPVQEPVAAHRPSPVDGLTAEERLRIVAEKREGRTDG